MSIFDIEMVPVSSSNLTAVGYDEQNNVLRIAFKSGDVYDYYDVPPDIFQNLMSAESLGSYHYYNIRMNFAYEKL